MSVPEGFTELNHKTSQSEFLKTISRHLTDYLCRLFNKNYHQAAVSSKRLCHEIFIWTQLFAGGRNNGLTAIAARVSTWSAACLRPPSASSPCSTHATPSLLLPFLSSTMNRSSHCQLRMPMPMPWTA
jgi:hypothetical protein